MRNRIRNFEIQNKLGSGSYGVIYKALDKSRREALSPHCPEIQGCIRCGVCEDQPNPSYPLPEKWKALGTSPFYLKAKAAS